MLDLFLQQKLRDLMAAEGLIDPEDLIDVDTFGRPKAYAICLTPGCYSTDRIPMDAVDGWCERCDRDTLMNGVMMANCGWDSHASVP